MKFVESTVRFKLSGPNSKFLCHVGFEPQLIFGSDPANVEIGKMIGQIHLEGAKFVEHL